MIPCRGAWLEFDIDKRDTIGVRIDRKRRQPVTVLLKALGWDTERIRERFAWSPVLLATLEKDHIAGTDEALLDIYRKLRPGEPPTRESAQALLENLFFKDKRYDLAKVGRYKLNKKLGLKLPVDLGVLHRGRPGRHRRVPAAPAPGRRDLDAERRGPAGRGRRHRPLRQPSPAYRRRADPEPDPGRAVPHGAGRPRADDHPGREAITPQTLINIRPVVASIKEFFGTSQLSQFMDQTNPLAGLTHKRRLSALGPGGLSRERASLEVRDVHPSHYGRMCPIETPEGPNIGLIGSLSTFARVNPFGFIETPYRKVEDGGSPTRPST